MQNKRRKVTKAELKKRNRNRSVVSGSNYTPLAAAVGTLGDEAHLRAMAIFGSEPETGFSAEQADLARWTLEMDRELRFMLEEREPAGQSNELRSFVLESAREQAEFAAAWDDESEVLRQLDYIPEPSTHLQTATRFCLDRIGTA